MTRLPTTVATTALLLLAVMGCSGGFGGPSDADANGTSDVSTSDTSPDAANQTDSGNDGLPVEYGVAVVARYAHDDTAFTQGLAFVDGTLYEGTGLYGESGLRQVDLASGDVLRQVPLADQYFGEGIAVIDDRLVQLTWQNQIAFVYDRDTFTTVGNFDYDTEGWGITRLEDGRLIMSDGTSTLYLRDASTFAELDTVDVRDERGPVRNLNELEAIDGAVWANVWQSDTIVIIDPATGAVTGRIDLTGLLEPADVSGRRDDVLNGIAFDEAGQRIFVTGKRWPWVFEVTLVLAD